jgi:7,8-dihydropterin-6-yl-methyl-4-(beta-D-ribofuranosyl)aminobenzene 5'-phosphate synthase
MSNETLGETVNLPKNSAKTAARMLLRITIVFDNNPFAQGLETSLGFACVIEGLEKTILFDTGSEGRMLLANMEKLGFALEDIGIVVLSHDHWDHTGGLGAFLQQNSKVSVFLPADFPPDFKNTVRETGASVVEVSNRCEICRGAWSTGVLGDGIREQSLLCESPTGGVLITGCAHPGIVKIVKVAKTIKPDIVLVMGGFHLGSASIGNLQAIAARFQDLKVSKVIATHCSGERARAVFTETYGEQAMLAGAGSVISVSEAEGPVSSVF